MAKDYLFVGTIVGLKGLDGTLKVASDDDFYIKSNAKVRVGYSLNFSEEFTLLSYKITSSKYNYIKLLEIDNIAKAKKLIEKGVFAFEQDTIRTKNEAIENSIGYQVIDIITEKVIGTALEIVPNPGNDLILVSTEQGEFYLPFVDAFVKKFDNEGKCIYVELIDGMIQK
jgi:ribosomal 30S subunit maturation factor RimM